MIVPEMALTQFLPQTSMMVRQDVRNTGGFFLPGDESGLRAERLLDAAAAEDLIVGFPNPNEVLEISTDLDVEGNVLVVNNGTLRINGARLRVRGMVHVFNSGGFEVHGGTLEFQQQYLYQYGLTFMNKASLWLDNAVVQCGGFNITCAATDTTALRIDGSSFSGGIMTTTLAGQARVDAQGSQRVGELLFFDQTRGSFTSCDGVLTWLTLPDASRIDATFPGAQLLGGWHFPDSARQHAGFDYAVSYSGCTNLLWGLMLEKGCEATLRNSSILAVGALFRGNGNSEISGLVNNAIPTSFHYPASDRDVQFENCAVQIWNLYTLDSYRLSVRNSIIGEILAMGGSDVQLQTTICDGTGGYVGTQDQARMMFVQSQITAPVIARDQSQLSLFQSSLQSYIPHAADNGVIALFNSTFPALPTVEAEAAAVVMGLDDPAQAEVDADVPLFGTMRFLPGSALPLYFTSFWFDAVREDTPDEVTFTARPSIRERYRDTIGVWDTRGHVSGAHILRLHMRLSSEDTISIPARVVLTESTLAVAPTPSRLGLSLSAWPNPLRSGSTLSVAATGVSPRFGAELTLTDVAGRIRQRMPVREGATVTLETRALPAGSYLLQLRQNGQSTESLIQVLH
jgi:hypothetical protein